MILDVVATHGDIMSRVMTNNDPVYCRKPVQRSDMRNARRLTFEDKYFKESKMNESTFQSVCKRFDIKIEQKNVYESSTKLIL